MKNIYSAGVITYIKEGNTIEYLLLNYLGGHWDFPKGKLEAGENKLQAAIRELSEETGARNVEIKRFLGILEHSFEPGFSSICHNHEYNLIFEVASEKLKINSKIPQIEDHIQILWMPVKDIINIDFRPEPLKNLILKWLECDYNYSFHSKML